MHFIIGDNLRVDFRLEDETSVAEQATEVVIKNPGQKVEIYDGDNKIAEVPSVNFADGTITFAKKVMIDNPRMRADYLFGLIEGWVIAHL